MNRLLITGCTGFIGTHLTEQLKCRQIHIRCLTRQQKTTRQEAGPEIHHGDLTKPDSLLGICQSVDTVIHGAGLAHALETNNEEHRQTTVEGTRHLLSEAARHRVQRFIFISSVKAMPEPGDDCLDETDDRLPADTYGLSRRQAEELVLEAGRRTAMHVSILRPALVYGPRCKGNLLSMMQRIDHGRFPPIPDTGNRRSMVDVRDLVRAILLAVDQPAASGRVFIITDGEDYSTRRIYTAILGAMGRTVPRWTVPASMLRILGQAGDAWEMLLRRPAPFNSPLCSRLLDSACYRSNIAQQVLGFQPEYRFEDAIPEMLAAYRESRDDASQSSPVS